MLNYQNMRLYDSYDEAISHAEMFNKRDLLEVFCFEVPHLLSHSLTLISIRQADSNGYIDSAHIDDRFPLPWIDVLTSSLDTSIGNHTYVFKFNNNLVNSEVNLYTSYNIRYNDPDKPYIYMDREDD
jgi:hypothetical protein